MQILRSHWLSPVIAVMTCIVFLFASTEAALAETGAAAPIEWSADADEIGLPAPTPLAILHVDASPEAPAAAPTPDVPQVVAAPAKGAMTKGMLVLLALVAIVVLAGVTIAVLFILDLTTDFDLFPRN